MDMWGRLIDRLTAVGPAPSPANEYCFPDRQSFRWFDSLSNATLKDRQTVSGRLNILTEATTASRFRFVRASTKMVYAWLGILAIGFSALMTDALSTTLMEDVQRADQVLRPKAKRAQELLMFGNQQNRQAESVPTNLFSPTAEKRTIGSSGLEEMKNAFPPTDKFSRTKPLSSSMRDTYHDKHVPPSYKGYQYGKILDNQLEDNVARNWLEENARNWDVPAYPRYYSVGDDRRKRSDSSSFPVVSTHAPVSTSAPTITEMPPQQPVAQAKRSLPLYQEPRYKRDLDPQDVLALLSLWEAERREGNWPGYDADEYDNGDEDNNIVDLDDEDPRNGAAWLEGPVFAPRHFSVGSEGLGSSDIGIPHTRPANYYDRYGNQFGQQYGNALYGAPQYSTGYRTDYAPEKRFMVSKKRSQAYRPYDGMNAVVNLAEILRTLPQSYGNYPNERADSSYYHRLNLSVRDSDSDFQSNAAPEVDRRRGSS